jgi:membrane-bound ClpP family serine protease
MEILITVGLIMIIIGFICLCTDANGWAFFWGVVGAYLLSSGIMIYGESGKPTAMDVYQGKTTLEITYKDGVAVDSIVVFKNKEK